MKIRKSTPEDIKQILSIYAYARSQMKRSGNPDQWKDHYPSLECSGMWVVSHILLGLLDFVKSFSASNET